MEENTAVLTKGEVVSAIEEALEVVAGARRIDFRIEQIEVQERYRGTGSGILELSMKVEATRSRP